MRVSLQHNTPQVVAAFMRAPQTMTREVDRKMARAAMEVAREERRLAPKAHSTLTQSITHRRLRPMDYAITAGVNYALAVEKGTGPGGSPPTQTLMDWIRVKGITPREGTSLRGLAFLIGRSIRRKGTKAQPFAEPALKSMTPRVLALMREGVHNGLSQAGSR